MTDPISAEVAAQTTQQLGGAEQAEQAAPGQDFAATFDQSGPAPEGVAEAGAVDGVAQVEQVQQAEEIGSVNAVDTEDFVQRLLQEESTIEEMMERCLNGQGLGPEEMLQMQAVIYSYSQRVELASKVVENAASGVKQVMNTQV